MILYWHFTISFWSYMQQFPILFWQFHNLFGAKTETSSFALSVLLVLWFYDYEISLLSKKIGLYQ